MPSKSLIFLFVTILFATCLKAQDPKTFFTSKYISLTIPELFHGKLFYLDATTGKSILSATDDLKHDKTLLLSFPSAISAVTIFKQDIGGDLSVAGQSISASNSDYVVIYDFTQTQQVSIPQPDNSVVSGLIGIAVRMTATIHTKKKGINLTNLFGIGLAANQDRLTGSLEVKAFGMSSQKINELIPVTADLSTGTIQNCLASVATIKSHIYDTETFITPLWLAFNVTGTKDSKNLLESKIDFKTLSNQIKTYSEQSQKN